MDRIFLHARSGLLLGLIALVPLLARAAEDGRRDVKVERYGIVTRVPQAWRLISWARDDKAFVLRLPQDTGTREGFVSCTLGIAPESLTEYQKRFQASDEAEQKKAEQKKTAPARKLLENRVEKVDAPRFNATLAKQLGERLVTVWQIKSDEETPSYELRTTVICDETLYTFTLLSDEAHFEAYRLDFEDMLASCVFTTPETGLQRMPAGYWMQRDFRFALQLPDGWRPAFGPNDKVLFFATGASHEVFTDNLLVLATPPRPLDLDEVRKTLLAEIPKQDAKAEVTSEIIPQGATPALETVIRTKQGPFDITILERRFSTRLRNYEVKFTCETAEFKKIEAALRKTLDSFTEVAEEPKPREA